MSYIQLVKNSSNKLKDFNNYIIDINKDRKVDFLLISLIERFNIELEKNNRFSKDYSTLIDLLRTFRVILYKEDYSYKYKYIGTYITILINITITNYI